MENYEELLQKNSQYLWNPFTQMKEYLQEEPLIIERGKGVKLIDVRGREYYDGNASVWLNVFGHNRKELNDALSEQLSRIAHSTLLGMSNVPAILLAERLVQITPDRVQKVFFSDSGAEAVEIALKMAFLYWKHRGKPEKHIFLSMQNAYHGDTVGAVSVGGIPTFHHAFDRLLFQTEKVPYPYPYRFSGTEQECVETCLAELQKKLEEKADQIAGLIVEPMVQGASGIIVAPRGYMAEVEKLCRQYDILLLADEVATGFGRTGKMFACEHEAIEPDILTVGKKLTGGYLPVAATLTSDEIYQAFYGDYADQKTFYHGHSYTGNQLGCAVALANLDLFEQEKIIEHVKDTSEQVAQWLKEFYQLSHVGEVRQLGLMIGIELVKEKESKKPYLLEDTIGQRVCNRAKELGLITRPLDSVITFLPALIAAKDELREMLDILYQAIQEVTESE
ncbi:adenosylmethionine--8-amino-7-oxononanoate transaminase [Shimazuella sp. AN120528]|uniref:adenosylmethionine--8-amino-7-oxononanoate transaminase n=1 Tax=Shimazuella soli TaxID=1892854 RepID=UPI001F1092E2|nr:adenosylmethionine--8-amino-7-oxononanoate transaminase [Shimazuella soli]MCH5585223.1 adenosylmethionine--8-amino-7-oxononanoate transaminase [Shimazuella soli]